jgi:predicted metalloprotease with PDZ domain
MNSCEHIFPSVHHVESGQLRMANCAFVRAFGLVETAVLLLVLTYWFPAHGQQGRTRVVYEVDVSRRADHILHVRIHFRPGSEQPTVQLPTWYALYQIRDFSQYLLNLTAYSSDGRVLPLRAIDKTSWRVTGGKAARFDYDIRCNLEGPYGLEIESDHVFINPALLLLFSPDTRKSPATVTFSDVPDEWKVSTPLAGSNSSFRAKSYDELGDSPFWLGTFAYDQFNQDGASIQVVVDAPSDSFTMQELVRREQEIIETEAAWMGRLPVKSYLLLYQFTSHDGVEGMEHSSATAITVPASATKVDMSAIDNVTAHEFFHLWNVKRIVPCSMVPVDYTHEQYVPELWFSEGATSAVARIMLLRAGMMDEKQYLEHLGSEISELENAPARKTQSVEDASVQVWLSHDSAYQEPDRSISHYHKGELLTVLLDLMIRRETHGRKSIQDVFRYLESAYEAGSACFQGDAGLQQAIKSSTGVSALSFFEQYVRGTEHLPYDEFLTFVGLHVVSSEHGRRVNWTVTDLPDITSEQRAQRNAWLGMPSQ